MRKGFFKSRFKGFIYEMCLLSMLVWGGKFFSEMEAMVSVEIWGEEAEAELKEIISLTESKKEPYPGLKAPARTVSMPLEGEKICYLTFDDGPGPHTEAIMDILKERGIKATFFVIGEGITEENRPILERMKDEGHSIGLHAFEHIYERFYLDADSILSDYEKLSTTLKEEYGIGTALFRFPGGSVCTYLKPYREVVLKELDSRGFACFDWHISGEDAVGHPTVESIQQNVFEHIFSYDTPIVLLHDGAMADKTADALPGIIERLEEEGYRFTTLETAPEYVYKAR